MNIGNYLGWELNGKTIQDIDFMDVEFLRMDVFTDMDFMGIGFYGRWAKAQPY